MLTAVTAVNNNNNNILFLEKQHVDVRHAGKKDIVQQKFNREIS